MLSSSDACFLLLSPSLAKWLRSYDVSQLFLFENVFKLLTLLHMIFYPSRTTSVKLLLNSLPVCTLLE